MAVWLPFIGVVRMVSGSGVEFAVLIGELKCTLVAVRISAGEDLRVYTCSVCISDDAVTIVVEALAGQIAADVNEIHDLFRLVKNCCTDCLLSKMRHNRGKPSDTPTSKVPAMIMASSVLLSSCRHK